MTPIVECDGLARTYPTQPPVEALRPSSFVVHGGEQVMVCGPSGSGKSTLLNLLGLLDSPTSGSYHLQGVDTAGLAEAERATLRATAIGFVFQSFHLLGRRSATENVETGLLYLGIPRPTRIAKAREALDRVGLGHRADADVATLSGGERQRVAIARAIVNRPALLLADEPTGNLDSATSAQILAILDELTGDGHAQLVVTHNPEIAALGSRRFDVLDGAVTEAPAP